MHPLRAAPAVLLAFVLAAAFGAAAAPAQAPDPAITDGSLQRTLDDARKRWKQAGVRSYSYEIHRLGTGIGPQKTFAVVVRDGRPKRFPAGLKSVATVPRLFALVQRAIDDGVPDLTARFGRGGVKDKRGVPSFIRIERVPVMDVVQYDVFRFKRRP